jgi:transcriptional regulator with XRE-family HTH domain
MTQLPVTRRVVQNMRDLRKSRGISAQQLAGLVRGLGVPTLNRSVIANLENGRRDAVTVDELYALAEALNSTPDYLAASLGVKCARCKDEPPAGYSCLACGAEGKSDDLCALLVRDDLDAP